MRNKVATNTFVLLFYIVHVHDCNIITISTNERTTSKAFKFYTHRRQHWLPTIAVTPPNIPGLKKQGEESGIYEPYWEEGDWVFNRYPTTSKAQASDSTATHAECNHVCLFVYKMYEEVCGMRLKTDDWQHEYKSFKDLCALQRANCNENNKRYGWIPIKKGNCTLGLTTHPTESAGIEARVTEWLNRLSFV